MRKSFAKTVLVTALFMLHIAMEANSIADFYRKIKNSEDSLKPELYYQVSEKLYETEQYITSRIYAKEGLNFAKANSNESLQIKLYELIGNSYHKQGINDSAVIAFQFALETAKLSSTSKDIPETLLHISDYYSTHGDNLASLNTLKEAVRILELEEDSRKIADFQNKLGRKYEAIGEFDKALEYYKKAKKRWIQLADEKNLIKSITNIGVIYFYWGEYEKAILQYNRCLNIAEKLDMKTEISQALNNIGTVYNALLNNEKAKDYFQMALEIDLEIGNKSNIAIDYNNIGTMYSILEMFDSSLVYYHNALFLYDSLKQEYGKIDVLANIALTYMEKENYSESLKHMQQSLKIAKQHGDQEIISSIEHDISLVYKSMKNYEKAEQHLLNSVKIAKKIGLKESLLGSYKEMSELYDSLGNPREALKYYRMFSNTRDTILTENIQNTVAGLEAKFESERKEKEIELLNNEKKHQENQINQQLANKRILIVLFAISFVLLIAIFIIFYQRHRTKHKHQLAKAIADQQKLRFTSVLQTEEKERKRIAQDLHDSLGQILSTAKLNLSGIEPTIEQAQENTQKIYFRTTQLIDQACSEVRNISHNIMPSSLIKVGLIAAIKDLAEKVNSSPEIDVNVNTENFPERLDEKTEFALYRIVQEIMSNIIKHSKASEVSIIFAKGEKNLICNIKDNGIGFSQDQIINSSGIGWKNIYSRLDLINGKMSIDSKKGSKSSTSIEIKFPFSIN